MQDASKCPDEIELCGLAQGTVSEERGAELRDHIGDCGVCRGAVADLARSDGDAAMGVTDDAREGDTRYELVRLVAAGGMGEVFVARDRVLGRDVAIKLLHEDTSSAGAAVASRRRVMREARALASLTHPNVVAVYDQGILDGRAYLAMEYVPGRTLRQWLEQESPERVRVIDMMLQAGRGLLAAHEMGFVHRDFKPDNVLVGDDGRARVTDFGLARRALVDGEREHDADTAISGTPAYMAPEQLAGAQADERSDQYGFCVTFYEALHGARPAQARHPGARPDVGPSATRVWRTDRATRPIDAAIARGLAVDPAARHASMGDLLAAIEAASRRGATRHRGRRVAIGAVVVVGLAGAGAAVRIATPRARPDVSTLPAFHAPCRSGVRECPTPLVCRFNKGNGCGIADEPGACGWPIDGCDANAPKVCGCDGVTYENNCAAHRQGVSVSHAGPCARCADATCSEGIDTGEKHILAFCRASPGSCGRDRPGVCSPRPRACASGGVRVCGCDGAAYENTCEARRAGTDRAYDGPCR